MSKDSFEYNAKSLSRNIGLLGCTHATGNHPTKGASDQIELREEVLWIVDTPDRDWPIMSNNP